MPKQCDSPQQQVNDYFSSSSEFWKTIYSDDRLLPTIYQDRQDTALEWLGALGLAQGARILEAGCGAGFVSIALAQSGCIVDAMDSTPAMLRMAGKSAADAGVQDRIRWHLADAHALPFQDQTFDAVVALGLIPWLHSEGLALQEMRRVLKRGGHLLITADNNARLNRILDPLSCPVLAPIRKAAKLLLQRSGSWSPDSGFQPRRHYPGEVNRLLVGCNFKKLKACTVGFGPFTLFRKELFADPVAVKLHRWLQPLAAGKRISPLRWTGAHYVVLARKMGS
jgi:ubiquinone/menaquinone biosynthesis C-methylase UbiE